MATPRSSIRAASQPATSPTARACRTNQGGGSRESRREAASTRPGTVIASMVPDGRGTADGGAGGVWAGRRRGRFGWRRRGRDESGDRDRAQERGGRGGRGGLRGGGRPRDRDARRGGDRAAAFGPDRHPVPVEPHDDRPVPIGPQDAGTRCRETIQGRLRRMAVRVSSAGRRDRHRGPRRIDECLRRRRAAAVVGDLEEVDVRQVVLQERRIDALLDVAHEQDATLPDLAEQHDRHVVDAGAAIGWRGGHLAAERPEDAEADLVDVEVVTGREPEPDRRTRSRQVAQPRRVARPRAAHARLEDPADLVALEQQGETGDVILVGVAEDDGVDPSVPRRDPGIEDDHQAARIRTTVDEQAAAARSLDEDGVALPDVEDGDRARSRPVGRSRPSR